MTWPISFVVQSRSKKSSSTPITTISVAAMRIAVIWRSLPSKNTTRKYGICDAISSAVSRPVYIATPPSRGVGRVCTSRSRISGYSLNRMPTRHMTIDIRKLTTAPASATSSVTITRSASVPPPRRAHRATPGPPGRRARRPGPARDPRFRERFRHDEGLGHGGLERLPQDDALAQDDEGARAVDQPRRVHDGRRQRTGGGAGVEVDVDGVAELLEGVLRRLRRRLPGLVRGADGERAGLGEQLERDPVVRHPQRDRASGVAEVPGRASCARAGRWSARRARTRRRAWWTASGTLSARASRVDLLGTRTGGGALRPRPFASSSAWTATGWNASAAMPYTVSVGMTTRSPRAIAARASRIPGSRLTGSAQSTTVAMSADATARAHAPRAGAHQTLFSARALP